MKGMHRHSCEENRAELISERKRREDSLPVANGSNPKFMTNRIMHVPDPSRLELPILLELKATGGSDPLRYLYERLPRYFPQLLLVEVEPKAESDDGRRSWRRAVQRAGKRLEAIGELKRDRTVWTITPRGLKRAEAEAMQPDAAPVEKPARPVTHQQAQVMLVEIGQWLGRHAEVEFEQYDVVWRDTAAAPRLSHVFEVQIAGSVDSALTRLKRAHDAQRSRLFLVISDEHDTQFARTRLATSFHEIQEAITVIGIGELQRFHQSIRSHEALLRKLLNRF
jgi:hypothetical protein